MQLAQHTRQFLIRHMEQRGVGEHAVEVLGRQVECQEVLRQHLAAAVRARQRGQFGRAVQADGAVTERLERHQVAPRAAAEVEQVERRRAVDVAQQGGDVLADGVITCAGPAAGGVLVVMRQREVGDLLQITGTQAHASATCGSCTWLSVLNW